MNLLPYDGSVVYNPNFIDQDQADEYYQTLHSRTAWYHDKLKMFGKEIITKRKVAWYGDEAFDYRYSGTSHIALPWTTHLQALKAQINEFSSVVFNCCLLNLYHDGNEGMGWHSDDESTLDKASPIASLSLGVPRRFSLKHKQNKKRVDVLLEPGSLLIMDAKSQQFWKHSLPVAKHISESRINLTFRVWNTR